MLTVTGTNYLEEKGKYSRYYVSVKCECGKEKTTRYDSILRGEALSCGCMSGSPISCGNKFPSRTKTEHILYQVWVDMNRRCYSVNRKDYKHYGGRGITVCDEWSRMDEDGFITFLKDMEDSYEIGLELERVDTEGNYDPNNCSWVCRKSQVNNTRVNHILEGFGVRLTVAEWSYMLGFNPKLLDDRINKGKDLRPLEDILADTFKDRRYSILYNGVVCSATDVWEAEGYTLGQRNRKITEFGDSITALLSEGIAIEVVKPREKRYRSFDEGMIFLEQSEYPYSKRLLQKLRLQQEVSK